MWRIYFLFFLSLRTRLSLVLSFFFLFSLLTLSFFGIFSVLSFSDLSTPSILFFFSFSFLESFTVVVIPAFFRQFYSIQVHGTRCDAPLATGPRLINFFKPILFMASDSSSGSRRGISHFFTLINVNVKQFTKAGSLILP